MYNCRYRMADSELELDYFEYDLEEQIPGTVEARQEETVQEVQEQPEVGTEGPDPESQVDEQEGEQQKTGEEATDIRTIRIRGSTQKPKKGLMCAICPGEFNHLRRHKLTTHLSWYVALHHACWKCKLQFGQTRFKDLHLLNTHPSDSEGCTFD